MIMTSPKNSFGQHHRITIWKQKQYDYILLFRSLAAVVQQTHERDAMKRKKKPGTNAVWFIRRIIMKKKRKEINCVIFFLFSVQFSQNLNITLWDEGKWKRRNA